MSVSAWLDEVEAAQARFGLLIRHNPEELRALWSDSSGALAGWRIGIKDNIALAGLPMTAGLNGAVTAERDAGVVRRLKQAGATLLPHLNMDEAALGGTTDNPWHGRTLNPLATSQSAGGSSGGSAAAVACGLVRAALGTDTMGSIRIPASWCGVAGLKPTAGLVGRSGVQALAPGFDTLGPIAASVADLWPVLSVIAGPDGGDPDSLEAPAAFAAPVPGGDLSGLRIAVPRPQVASAAPEVLAALELAVAALTLRGATVVHVEMPLWRPAALRRAAFLMTEAQGAVALAGRFDRMSAPIRALLGYGAGVASAKLVKALEEMRAATAQWSRTLATFDAVLSPTTPQTAPTADMPVPSDQADFTVPANVAGLPSLALPVSVPGHPLPASVQLTGRAWDDPLLLRIGMALEDTLRAK